MRRLLAIAFDLFEDSPLWGAACIFLFSSLVTVTFLVAADSAPRKASADSLIIDQNRVKIKRVEKEIVEPVIEVINISEEQEVVTPDFDPCAGQPLEFDYEKPEFEQRNDADKKPDIPQVSNSLDTMND